MPREFKRTQRLGERIHRVLGELVGREIHDPRMGFVTITGVEVSRDFGHAKVYFSVLGEGSSLDETTKILKGATGFLRSRLGKELIVRTVPNLEFVHDDSLIRAARLQSLLDDAEEPGLASDEPRSGD